MHGQTSVIDFNSCIVLFQEENIWPAAYVVNTQDPVKSIQLFRALIKRADTKRSGRKKPLWSFCWQDVSTVAVGRDASLKPLGERASRLPQHAVEY